jgi:hypothetical protein
MKAKGHLEWFDQSFWILRWLPQFVPRLKTPTAFAHILKPHGVIDIAKGSNLDLTRYRKYGFHKKGRNHNA